MNDETVISGNPSSDEEIDAVAYQAHKSVMRLVDRTTPAKGGSCVPIKIGSKFFLATAAHVIPQGHQMNVVVRQPQGRCIEHFLACHRNDQTDVGLLELDSKDASQLADSFVSENQILITLDQEKEWPVLVVGYPGVYAAPILREIFPPDAALEVRAWNAFTYSGFTVPFSEWPNLDPLSRSSDELRDMFINYDPNDEEAQFEIRALHPNNAGTDMPTIKHRPPPPHGMSGGGVWLARESLKGGIWQPSPLLVALQVAWKKSEGWMRGILIGEWLELVEREFPDLKENIAAIRKNEH